MANAKKIYGNRGGGRIRRLSRCLFCDRRVKRKLDKRGASKVGICWECRRGRAAADAMRRDRLMNGKPIDVDWSNAPIAALAGWRRSGFDMHVTALVNRRKQPRKAA
jgi:hypothetical protein